MIPWDVAGLQSLNSLGSSEGLQVRGPHLASHGTALSPALGPLLWTRAGGAVSISVYGSCELKETPQAFSRTFRGAVNPT